MKNRLYHFTLLLTILLHAVSCKPSRYYRLPMEKMGGELTGSAFYRQVMPYNWKQRDSLAVKAILSGNMPSFLLRFHRVEVAVTDSSTGRTIRGWYYVSPDYLSVGTDADWARVPLTPNASQRIADSLGCFLPTRKMVNDIYKAATARLEPIPLTQHRDSSLSMWQHHQMIEEQRQGKTGLIAGIKKDVVITARLAGKNDRVAIYGWHKPDGRPIQPLYTGHVNWYVDYSHGTRLVYKKIWVEGKAMDFTEVFSHPLYRLLLCDEPACDYLRYPY